MITLAPLPPKPDPTPCTVIYSLGVVAVFRHAQEYANSWQYNYDKEEMASTQKKI